MLLIRSLNEKASCATSPDDFLMNNLGQSLVASELSACVREEFQSRLADQTAILNVLD